MSDPYASYPSYQPPVGPPTPSPAALAFPHREPTPYHLMLRTWG